MDAPARRRQCVEQYSMVKRDQYGINPKTVAKRKKRAFANNAPMGSKEVRTTVLTSVALLICTS